jgi:hypothetical protein
MENPLRLVVIGFGLLLIGVVLPFLMVLKLVESTLFLNFLAVASSVGGLTTGFMGITQLRSRK